MKAIIFDCDGTLVDSERLGNEVLVEAVSEHGLSISVDEALLRFRGGKMADCVTYLEDRLGRSLPHDFVPTVRTRTAEAFRARLKPVDGAFDLLQSVTDKVCVASSGPQEKIRLSLSLTGLLPFFDDRIFSSYDIGSWKPDPDLFLHAARAIGVRPQDCSVVEDSLLGVQAGLAAGMKVFAFQPHDVDARLPSEAVVVTRLADLREWLVGPALSSGLQNHGRSSS